MVTRQRKVPQEFVDEITVDDDGISPIRSGRLWSLDKLAVLAYYLPGFTTAAKSAAATCLVDGFAGPGMDSISKTRNAPIERYVLGSTMVALATQPQFSRCIALDSSPAAVTALKLRTHLDKDRVVIERGDCNSDLLHLMQTNVPGRAATFVLLDPEGYALDFATVEQVARFRSRPRRVEIMTLVDSGSAFRAARAEMEGKGASRFSWALPVNWRELIERYEEGDLRAGTVRSAIAQGFCDQLKALGYKHAFPRAITRGERDGAAVYHLAFATDHDRGKAIMESAFARMHVNERPRRGRGPRVDPRQASLL